MCDRNSESMYMASGHCLSAVVNFNIGIFLVGQRIHCGKTFSNIQISVLYLKGLRGPEVSRKNSHVCLMSLMIL